MGESIRVFLVDGHAIMRDAMRALITTVPDMEVVSVAADSTGALEQALRLRPDVIILDLSTLGSNSLSVVKSLMEIRPQPHILLLSNEINQEEILAAIEAGVKGYLLKGTVASEILQAIRGLYGGQLVFDPAMINGLL